MASSRRVVKVFLASPGDLSDERKTAKLVVDELNDLLAEELGYQVELVGWEDTVSVYGRPQAIINRELERCELFVGLIWKRWGTPPDVSGAYSSGFEEEFERSVQRRLNEGRPEISLLFKEISQEFLVDPGEDLKKVLAFKEKLVAEKTILFEHFGDTRELEKKVRRCITEYILRLRAQEQDYAAVQDRSTRPDGGNLRPTDTQAPTAETPLSTEGAEFLRDFVLKSETGAEDAISATDVARFRLLGTLVGRQGNDDRTLGVHDSNLLFTIRNQISLGQREITGLVASGLEHYREENTPIWYWFAAIGGFARRVLPLYSLIGSDARRIGALAAMRLLSEPLPTDRRSLYLDSWFAEDASSSLRVAALAYLGECGIAGDLENARVEFDRNDYQTRGAAADAIISINLRTSREKAISALYEVQPAHISEPILDQLFANDAALSNELLLSGIGHQDSGVRRIIARLLGRRGALPVEVAEQLSNDSDADVRYEALRSLVAAGRKFSEAEAKGLLVKRSPSGGFGLIGMAIDGGERCFTKFRRDQLGSLQTRELEEAARTDSIFDQDARLVLAEKRFNQHGNDLRELIDDQYRGAFSRAIDGMAQRYGAQDDLIEKTRSLEEHMRKKLTRQALDIVCRKGESKDLLRVRIAVASGFLDYSEHDVEYLRKFGEWEDIPLIINCLTRSDSGSAYSLLSRSDESTYRVAARAIYALGRNRLSEVLTMSAPSRLLSFLVVGTSDKSFRGLSDAAILALFAAEDDRLRKVAALKCVKAIPRKRVNGLLATYMSTSAHRYYNVVHWLDFGISVPRELAFRAVEKLLHQEWQV